MSPLSGNIIIEMAVNVGYAIIDRLLGGSGESLDKVRDFSEIEISILERIFNIIIGETASEINIGNISSDVDKYTAINVPNVITRPA